MKKLTREEAQLMDKRPFTRACMARIYLMNMQPGDIILLERKDWTRKHHPPTTLIYQIERKEKREYKCDILANRTGWIIERLK